MTKVTFIYRGKVYRKDIFYRFGSMYKMYSKGEEIWFNKNLKLQENFGWVQQGGNPIPPDVFIQIALQLELLESERLQKEG